MYRGMIRMVYVIVSPHPDDLLIGTFKVFVRHKNLEVIFVNELTKTDKKEIELLEKENKDVFNSWFCHGKLDQITNFLNLIRKDITLTMTIFVPCNYDTHPLHNLSREVVEIWVAQEWIKHKRRVKIIYYSTNMNTPYLQELLPLQSVMKKDFLNKYFPSQKSLWEYDHKYFLFESYIQQVIM
jgi:hypothetical protein